MRVKSGSRVLGFPSEQPPESMTTGEEHAVDPGHDANHHRGQYVEEVELPDKDVYRGLELQCEGPVVIDIDLPGDTSQHGGEASKPAPEEGGRKAGRLIAARYRVVEAQGSGRPQVGARLPHQVAQRVQGAI